MKSAQEWETLDMETTKYRELVQALLTGSMDPLDFENAIKIALGELADVWPANIRCAPDSI